MRFQVLVAVLCGLLEAVSAKPHLPRSKRNPLKRATIGSTQLYCYGSSDTVSALGGMPVFYAGGLAFCGSIQSSNVTGTTQMNVTISDTIVTASPLNTTWNSTRTLWLDTDASAYNPVFLESSTPSDSYTDSGFTWFGKYLFWTNSTGVMQSNWYASLVPGQTDVYVLKWNAANVDDGNGTAVSLKSEGPPKLELS